MTEILVAVLIIGILSSIALPNYFRQMARTRQKECSAVLSQILVSTMAFNDEFSEKPTSWAELNSMSAILLSSGTASSRDDFDEIVLRGRHYWMTKEPDKKVGNNIILEYNCKKYDPSPNVEVENVEADVKGCVSLFNGATDIRLGDISTPAQDVNCE